MNQSQQIENKEQSLTIVQAGLERNKQILEGILPKHIHPDAFIKTCNGILLLNPYLLELEPKSVVDSLLMAARDGLIPDGREAAIVPYKGKAQYQVMVDGILKKVRQSGVVTSPMAKAVFENDSFDYWMDENGEHLEYRPALSGDRGEFKLAFAVAKYIESGDRIVEIMTKEEVERVKNASPSSSNSSSPWQKWYDRMAVKSVLHRLSRRLPNSTEIMEMIEREIPISQGSNHKIVNIQQEGACESSVQKLSEQQIQDLKALVELSGVSTPDMFAWVSAQTKRSVNDFGDLDQEQLKLILPHLQKKASA